LKTKGYISQESSTGGGEIDDSDVSVSSSDGNVYIDMKILKEACLRFSRERYDIFPSFPKNDIQALVEKGCPNLNRKSVNTSKRLRVYVGLDEGDVCGACKMRGSCDKAYWILKDVESVARTVDVVRILLLHALDPVLISGEKMPHGRECINESARKLLSKLVELSDTAPNPDISIPEPRTILKTKKTESLFGQTKDAELKKGDWMCSECNFLNFARNRSCRQCGEQGPKNAGTGTEREGDWTCLKCKFSNFARNRSCRECGEQGPKNAGSGTESEIKKGDWKCPGCNFVNFARNIRCLKCKTEGPKITESEIEMKPGDWNCPKCWFMNFSSNTSCKRCSEIRPPRELRPGEWECPSCKILNFKGKMVCKKCSCKGPKEAIEAKYEDQIWKRPY
jgi:hypothetical protein